MRHLVTGLLLAASAGAAQAGTVAVDVRDAAGNPVAGAVVTLSMPGVPAPQPKGTYAVSQQNISFQPHVLIVPVGASVEFPNRDRVRHHVYSFSKPKRFDLKLYGREEQRSIVFDKPGVVALGCNIHDQMSGFVFVTPTRYAAISDARGHVSFAGVPSGRATLGVWHPSIKAPGNALAQPASIPASAMSTTVTLSR